MKECSTCKQLHDISFFNKDMQKKDGLNPRCKNCSRAWHHKNKDKVKVYQSNYYANNLTYHSDKAKKFRAKNRELLIINCKKWHEKNKENAIEYRKNNAAKYAEHARNRRAKIGGKHGTHTHEQISNLLIKQKHKCAICKCSVSKYHVDHIVPLFLNGSNAIDNLQILCPPCNLSKNKTDPIVYMNRQGFLL